jgi:ATP/maltotriose-dependent transcriptional regulator MalT
LQDVSKGQDWIATTRLEIMRAQVLAHLAAAQGDHAKARDWLNKAVSRARDTGADHRLWRALGELALIEEAMGHKGSAATREEAQAVWTKVGATIPDTEHRAAFMRGPIACRLGLSKATQGSGGPQ